MVQVPRRGAGFSLVELMVVVGVLALLIGLILPALGGARRSARVAVCASNLSQLHKAFAVRRVDETGPRGASLMPVVGPNWITAVSDYVNREPRVLVCPEAPPEKHRVGVAMAAIHLKMYRGTLDEQISDSVQDITLAPNPQSIQVDSGDPYNGHGVLNIRDDANGSWGDIVLDVQQNADGTTTFTVVSEGHYWHYQMFNPDGSLLADLPGITGPSHGSIGKTFTTGGSGSTNYAINGATRDQNALKLMSASVIHLLDYKTQLVADVGPTGRDVPPSPQSLWPEADGSYGFARHPGGRLNILLGDGSVSQRRPLEITPADPRLLQQWWLVP